MRKTFMIALAAGAATLGIAAGAQGQTVRQIGPQDRMAPQDRLAPRALPPRRDQSIVSRDQSLELRTEIHDLGDRVTKAQQARRITAGQGSGFRRELNNLQRQFWVKMQSGMTRGEYMSVNTQIGRIRMQFEGILARNDRRPHR